MPDTLTTLAPHYVGRILPPEEWEAKLAGVPPFDQIPLPGPELTEIAVVENERGEVVACWLMMTVVHLEALYIKPAQRHAYSVGKKIFETAMTRMREVNVGTAFTIVTDLDVMTLALKNGFKLVPGSLLVIQPQDLPAQWSKDKES